MDPAAATENGSSPEESNTVGVAPAGAAGSRARLPATLRLLRLTIQ